jgi:hypothetical protein
VRVQSCPLALHLALEDLQNRVSAPKKGCGM